MPRTPDAPVRTTLGNGLTVLCAGRPAAPVVAVLILYRAGSARDPDGLKGLAHLAEHMMFRGTSRFPDGTIDDLTNGLGGVNNAVTTHDYTAYYFVLPRENWRVALELEADRMSNCLLDVSAFDSERNIAIEERQMLDDEPESVLDEALENLAYERHPYRFPVVGLVPDLRRASASDLRAFYRTHYRPSNAVLAVAGAAEPEEVERVAREAFRTERSGGSAAGGLSRFPEVAPEPRQKAPRSVALRRESGIPRLMTAFHCPEATHADSPALEVAAVLLGSGRSSRLYQRLVASDGDVNDVSVCRLLQPYPGLFTVSAELSEGGSVEACEQDVLEELSRLADVGPSTDELVRSKRLWRLDHAVGTETSLGLAGSLGFWELLGDWTLGDRFAEAVDSVTAEEVSRAVGAYLDPDVRNSAWMTIEG
ncbi:MAG: pitrilysin family protein [Candidatus Eisenbacteria bacterium]